jgi:ParB-like chromosome segregation protein Spo0J
MKVLKFSQIRIDGGTQMRVSINQDKVSEYAEKMREEAVFPPIKVMFDGTVYWLYDGFHRYFAAQSAGFNAIQVDYKPGTMEDAQDLALRANNEHGLPRTNEDKRKAVETALSYERHAKKSDREIGRLCDVSHTLVAAVRNPEIRKQQAKNYVKHLEKVVAEDSGNNSTGNNSTGNNSTPDPKVELTQDYGPDEQELKANELAQQADLETMNKLLESDDALATAHAEVKRLNHLVSQLQVRISVLMREKNAAIDMVKEYQAKEKKAKK